jgi:hypothetical protein
MKSCITALLLLIIPSTFAQTPNLGRCVSGGGVTVENCHCSTAMGQPASKRCEQLVPAVGAVGSCPVVCEPCECQSGSQTSGAGQTQGTWKIERADDNEPFPYELKLPPRPDATVRTLALQLCIGEHRKTCPADISWLTCPQGISLGDEGMARTMCTKMGFPNSYTYTWSKSNGNMCGYTRVAVTCSRDKLTKNGVWVRENGVTRQNTGVGAPEMQPDAGPAPPATLKPRK